MHITIDQTPNALGLYRYEVSESGRSTVGYRTSREEARKSAQADGSLLYLGGRADCDDEEVPEAVAERLARREGNKRGPR